MFSFVRKCVLATVLALLAGNVFAREEYNGPWEKFRISVGGFTTQSDTTLQINSGSLGVGAVVDLEDALGVERGFSTYRIDAGYQLGATRRHQIEFHYFDAKRSGTKSLDEQVEIGDEVFPIGASVDTEFRLRFVNFDYVYNFLMDDRVRLGASIGLHTTRVGLKVESGDLGLLEDEAFTAPLPMLGLRADVILAPKWRLKTDINLFYLEYDGYTGRLGDTYVGLEYLPFKHFGFGAGINNVNYRIEADSDSPGTDLNGELKFQLTGFMLYGKYFF